MGLELRGICLCPHRMGPFAQGAARCGLGALARQRWGGGCSLGCLPLVICIGSCASKTPGTLLWPWKLPLSRSRLGTCLSGQICTCCGPLHLCPGSGSSLGWLPWCPPALPSRCPSVLPNTHGCPSWQGAMRVSYSPCLEACGEPRPLSAALASPMFPVPASAPRPSPAQRYLARTHRLSAALATVTFPATLILLPLGPHTPVL